MDEAGRGPLAGPVVAAAVILDPSRRIRGLADSKALTPKSASAWLASFESAASPGPSHGPTATRSIP